MGAFKIMAILAVDELKVSVTKSEPTLNAFFNNLRPAYLIMVTSSFHSSICYVLLACRDIFLLAMLYEPHLQMLHSSIIVPSYSSRVYNKRTNIELSLRVSPVSWNRTRFTFVKPVKSSAISDLI